MTRKSKVLALSLCLFATVFIKVAQKNDLETHLAWKAARLAELGEGAEWAASGSGGFLGGAGGMWAGAKAGALMGSWGGPWCAIAGGAIGAGFGAY